MTMEEAEAQIMAHSSQLDEIKECTNVMSVVEQQLRQKTDTEAQCQ